jgi:hypothetical protein
MKRKVLDLMIKIGRMCGAESPKLTIHTDYSGRLSYREKKIFHFHGEDDLMEKLNGVVDGSISLK